MRKKNMRLIGVIRLGGGINWRSFVRAGETTVLTDNAVLLYR
jgi:hypothetical protein